MSKSCFLQSIDRPFNLVYKKDGNKVKTRLLAPYAAAAIVVGAVIYLAVSALFWSPGRNPRAPSSPIAEYVKSTSPTYPLEPSDDGPGPAAPSPRAGAGRSVVVGNCPANFACNLPNPNAQITVFAERESYVTVGGETIAGLVATYARYKQISADFMPGVVDLHTQQPVYPDRNDRLPPNLGVSFLF